MSSKTVVKSLADGVVQFPLSGMSRVGSESPTVNIFSQRTNNHVSLS